MKKFVVLFLLFNCISFYGQGLAIKEMKEIVSGSDAFHAPNDSLGHPCGLIKVLSTVSDLEFEGQIVGNVSKHTNEYHVYMMRGSNELIIKRPHVLPLLVNFKDFGIEVVSKATYQITLKELKINTEKNRIIVVTKPQKARLYVNNIPIDNADNGGYQIFLPKDEYVLRIEMEGYRPQTHICKIGKGLITLDVELESLMANLDVTCSTSGAEIFVNGKKVAVDSWQGALPAGKYEIDAQKYGYISEKKTVVLAEKDIKKIIIPELERKRATLNVKTMPIGSDIYIDGVLMGKSGDNIGNITIGTHTIELKAKFGYAIIREEVDIDNEDKFIERTLRPLNETYRKAFNGDIDAQMLLAEKYIDSGYGDIRTTNPNEDIEQSDYWFSEAYKRIKSSSNDTFLKHCDKLISFYRGHGERTYMPSRALELYLRKGEIKKSYENINIAGLYGDMKKWDEAIKWVKREIEEGNGNHTLEQLYSIVANYSEKKEDYDEALKWYNLAKEEKLKEYRTYLSTDDYTYKVYCITTYGLQIADIYVKKNDIRKAVELYRQLKGKFRDDPAGKRLKELGY
jgi:tetratricopeptide (TPR) repeat protein